MALFDTAAFSDLRINLRPSADPSLPPLYFNVHKAIVSAFPFLRDVLQVKAQQSEPANEIDAFTGPGFTNAWAFRMAFATLYGGELVCIEEIRRHALCGLGWADQGEFGPYPFNLDQAKVNFAICYAASGAFMGDADITERGIRMAIQLLSWSTVEIVMGFGMAVEKFMITCPDLLYRSPGSGNSPTLHLGPRPIDSRMEHIHEFKYMWAQMALDAAVQFVVTEMKPDFELYHRAQASFTPTRIPAAVHTLPESQLTNWRLENIQFGSMPSFASLRPTRPDLLIPSGLLITLPFEMLVVMIDTMRVQESPKILTLELLHEILEVREARRLHAIRILLSRGYYPSRSIPDDEFTVLGYREFVKVEDHQRRGDLPELFVSFVQREWVGICLPNEELAATDSTTTSTNS